MQLIVAWAQTIYNLKINGKMAVIGSTSYMWKVLHMPMEFFSQRMAGDIQSRQATNASIAGTLVNAFAPLLLNSIMMIFYLVLMLKQSLLLTAIGLSTLVLNIFVSRIISEKRVNITRVQQRDAAKLAATTVAGVEMIETIKASGSTRALAGIAICMLCTAIVSQLIGSVSALLSSRVQTKTSLGVQAAAALLPTAKAAAKNYGWLPIL